jgi:hypothetical protein
MSIIHMSTKIAGGSLYKPSQMVKKPIENKSDVYTLCMNNANRQVVGSK